MASGSEVQNLIDEEEFVFKHIVVQVNGVPIDEEIMRDCHLGW